MRWPFRREAPADPKSAPVDAAPSPAVVPRPEAWRELEPLRTLEPVELTTDGIAFSRGLGVRQRPALALAPLGHDLLLEAPRGIASGIARTVTASDRISELPLAPTTRTRERPAPVRRAPRPVQAAAESVAPVPPLATLLVAPPAAESTLGALSQASTAAALVERPAPQEDLPERAAPAPRALAAVRTPPVAPAPRGVSLPLVPPRPVPTVERAVAPSATPVPPAAPVASPPTVSSAPVAAPAPVEPAEPVAEAEPFRPAEQLPTVSLPLVGERREPPVGLPEPPSIAKAATPVAPAAPPLLRRPGLGAPIAREPDATPEPRRVVPAPPPPAATPAATAHVAPPRAVQREARLQIPWVPPAPAERVPPEPFVPGGPTDSSGPPAPPPVAPGEPPRAAPLVGELDLPARREPTRPVEALRPASERRAVEPLQLPVARPSAAVPLAVRGLSSSPTRSIPRSVDPAPVSPTVSLAPDASLPAAPLPGRAQQVAWSPPSAPRPVVARPAPLRAGRSAESSLSPGVVAAPEAFTPSMRRLAAAPAATSTLAPAAGAPASAPVRRETSAASLAWPATTQMPARPTPPAPSRAPFVRPVQRAVIIDEVQITQPPPATAPVPAPAPQDVPAAPTQAPAPLAPPSSVQSGTAPVAAVPHAPAASASAAQDSERLREQVLRWVRAELLVDRERAGRLTDLR